MPSAEKKQKKKKSQVKKKNVLSTDDFFEQDFENIGDSESDDDELLRIVEKPKTKAHESDEEQANDSDSGESDLDPHEHKKALLKLKDTDPEFYKYLEQNDTNLLDFDASEDDDDDDDGDDASLANEDDSKHIPNPDLEVASDDSDFEADEGEEIQYSGGPVKVTLKLLNAWTEELETDKSSKTIKKVVAAFHAALENLANPDSCDPNYKVEGGTIFNGIIQLCITHLPTAFKKFLKLGDDTRFEAHKAKKFKKIKGSLQIYLTDLIQVLKNVSSSDILATLLKHLHAMIPYMQSFSKLRKPLFKILLEHWSNGEETVRVIAFLCILKITTSYKEVVLDALIKDMYMKYVKNSKFVSPTTYPGINFMKHSLSEICLLDNNVSYHHGFLYIRQLAIHLRNAITLKKKENFEIVYNWQYINSIKLWAQVISLSKEGSMLRQLLYPLVQIITGVIRLIPTTQYYPLRFHCTQILIDLSKDTGVFIPSLPFALEVLNQYDFSKKHKNVTMKPISFICSLRMSKSQLQENGFKDSVIETVYQLILENAAKDSHTVYFPDMYVPCVVQIKTFLKKCHVPNYNRKFKQLLDLIEEGRKYIEKERSKITLDLRNMKEIENWERKIKQEGTPIDKFYKSWIKIHQSQKLKILTQNDDIGDFKLPIIKKSKKNPADKNSSVKKAKITRKEK